MSCRRGAGGRGRKDRDPERDGTNNQGCCRASPEQGVLVPDHIMQIADVSGWQMCVRVRVNILTCKGVSLRAFSDEFSTRIKRFSLVSFIHSFNENWEMKELVKCC